MKPVDQPICGARKPEYLLCAECHSQGCWTACARTLEGIAAVISYHCSECVNRGLQVVRLDTTDGFEELRSDYKDIVPRPAMFGRDVEESSGMDG